MAPPSKGKQRAKSRPQKRPNQPRPAPARRPPATPARQILPAWPPWIWVWLVLTAFIFLLRAGNALSSVPLCVFLSAVAGAFCYGFDQLRHTGPAHPLLRARQIVLVAVVVAMPSLFDPSTIDVDDLPRLVFLTVAAVLIVGLWAVDATWNGWRPHRLVNGFQWILLAIVVWFGVTVLTSVEPRNSFLGRTGSYEGFLLLAALAVLASALAETFTADALPALFRVVVAAASPALVYGAIQFYGFDVHKHSSIDFVQWASSFHNVFASFGNPNHYGGFLVTVLPLGVVAAVLATTRWSRVFLWGWVAVDLVLLLQTAARGAWLAGIVAGGILVVGLLPRLRASARTAALVGGGALVVVVALIVGGSRFLGAKAAALLQFGSGSSVSQRYGYWSAALHLAQHHPLVGTGPDTYGVTYAQYQGASLAKTLGTSFFVNGAHNIFLSWLANEGIPGFLLILALFVFGVAWGTRAWMAWRTGSADSPVAATTTPSEVHRYVAAGLVAAFVGYFVQACFDVEQVGTLFTLFVVLGLLGVANRGVWSRRRLLRLPFGSDLHPASATDGSEAPADEDLKYPALVLANRGSATRNQTEMRRLGFTLLAGALALTALGLTYWRTDALWRADYQARIGTQAAVVKATQLNPWEPSYFGTLGEGAAQAFAQNPKASDAVTLIQDAVSYLHQDVSLDGANAFAQEEYGDALGSLGNAENSKPILRQAVATLEKAQREDPFNAQIRHSLAVVSKALG
jgi:O-antigen ligase